jgi:hypothetical protein
MVSGYVIMLDGKYVKWHDSLRWTLVTDPKQASRYQKSDTALMDRPYKEARQVGTAVLLRPLTDGH